MPGQLVTYADPLLALDKVRKGKVLVLPKEVPVSYFKPLIDTRHTDPENGLLYETVEVKMNREGFLEKIGLIQQKRLKATQVHNSDTPSLSHRDWLGGGQ